jgi:uncharacterized protein involved in response to NO
MPWRMLFPLAALFALTAVPFWLGLRHAYPALTGASWHGHEMIFGYAFAVIAGFLVTRPARATSWILLASWLGARVAAAGGPGPLALIIGLAFPVTVLAVTLPPLFAGAKRRENLLLPVILIALLACDTAWWAGAVQQDAALQLHALLAVIDLLALLLLVIGGRALRAAAGNQLEQQGIERRDHRQRRYELPMAALAGGVALSDAAALPAIAGILCVAAAVLATVRALPWQLHRTLAWPQTWSLALGYLWLVAGLALKGIAQFTGTVPVHGVLHALGIGALGTLTLVMMARTATLRAHRPITNFRDIGYAALLVSLAALARLAATFIPSAQQVLLWSAAVAWCSAFLILLARLLRNK